MHVQRLAYVQFLTICLLLLLFVPRVGVSAGGTESSRMALASLESKSAAGDVNCSGSVTSADIIYLVNHVFKGGPLPCDVCTMVPVPWSCP